MAADNDLQYDENEAIKFIRDYMPENIRDNYTDDEILNVLDMIWDYYEDNGYLEIPAADTDDGLSSSPAADDLLKYVNKMLGKDKLAVVDSDDVHYIVEGELAYEKSIGLED